MNWRTIAFILENTVFLLIGLQAAGTPQRRPATARSRPAGSWLVCAATLVGVIVLRMVWVFIARYLLVRPGPDPATGRPRLALTFLARLGRHARRRHPGGGVRHPGGRRAPRGPAADRVHRRGRHALPPGPLPAVAGAPARRARPGPASTTRWPAPPSSSRPRRPASRRSTRLDVDDPHGVVDLIRQRIDQRNFAAWERLAPPPTRSRPASSTPGSGGTMIDAERGRVLEIRKSGTVPSEVISDVLAMLDVEESMLESASAEREDLQRRTRPAGRLGEVCDDLERLPGRRASTRRRSARPASTRARAGWRCAAAWSAATSAAATPRRGSTPPRTSTRRTHAVMQSAEPDEDWRWCYVHHLTAADETRTTPRDHPRRVAQDPPVAEALGGDQPGIRERGDEPLGVGVRRLPVADVGHDQGRDGLDVPGLDDRVELADRQADEPVDLAVEGAPGPVAEARGSPGTGRTGSAPRPSGRPAPAGRCRASRTAGRRTSRRCRASARPRPRRGRTGRTRRRAPGRSRRRGSGPGPAGPGSESPCEGGRTARPGGRPRPGARRRGQLAAAAAPAVHQVDRGVAVAEECPRTAAPCAVTVNGSPPGGSGVGAIGGGSREPEVAGHPAGDAGRDQVGRAERGAEGGVLDTNDRAFLER